jgi:SAM-dependent methyltransferase
MATIDENLKIYNETYSWPEEGDEWSKSWGSAKMQWNITILPRIQTFLPSKNVLELAPGFGRWTQFLKNYSENLYLVDFSEKCINNCKKRFVDESNIKYFVNDGLHLDMIEDKSIDFIFSFDSLVHVDEFTMKSYIKEISKKLSKNGIAFLHHSNLKSVIACPEKIKQQHLRDNSVDFNLVKKYCGLNNLKCISQELINWDCSSEYLIDCFTLITTEENDLNKIYKLFENNKFMEESQIAKKLSKIYT